MQGFLRVCVSVAALADVVGLQLDGGLNGGDWLLAGLQTNTREQGQTSCAGLVLNSFIKSLETRHVRDMLISFKVFSYSQNTMYCYID